MAKTILTPFQTKVLNFFSKQSGWFDRFYLSGGTALSEFHLHHRLSEDLDFFSEEEFSLTNINILLKKLKIDLPEISTIEFREFMGIRTFFIHYPKGVLKIDFNYYPFPRLEKGGKFNNLSIDSLMDIAVNKMQTISTKPRSRDFVDLYLIVKSQNTTLKELGRLARLKFDWFVDPLHLASRFLMAKNAIDLPRMLIPLEPKIWQDFFVQEAKKLEGSIISK